jgi:hypothetical protein
MTNRESLRWINAVTALDRDILAVAARMHGITVGPLGGGERYDCVLVAQLEHRLQKLEQTSKSLPRRSPDMTEERERLSQGISYLWRTLQRMKPAPMGDAA